jgi:hypothetical protein
MGPLATIVWCLPSKNQVQLQQSEQYEADDFRSQQLRRARQVALSVPYCRRVSGLAFATHALNEN